MTTDDKLILAILVAFRHELSWKEMAEIAGMSRTTFKRKANQMIQIGHINGHLESLGYHRHRGKVDTKMDTSRLENPTAKKSGQKVDTTDSMVITPTEEIRTKSGHLDFGTGFAIKDIGTNNININNNASTSRKGIPLREQNCTTPHTKLRSYFDEVHFKTHNRDASFGKHDVAMAQAKELFKRGLNLKELKRAVEYFHTLQDDWVTGHTWAAFYAGAYSLVDASKKTGKFVKMRPDLDRDIKAWLEGKTDGMFSDLEMAFLDECQGARPKNKADSMRFSCLKEREEAASEFEKEKDDGYEPTMYTRHINVAMNDAKTLLSLTGDKL